MRRSWIRFWMNGWLRMSLIKKILNGIKRSGKKSGSYLEQETFNAQYAWDKIDRINKKRYNKRKRLVNIGYIISGVAATLLLVLGFSKMEYLINSRKCWFE